MATFFKVQTVNGVQLTINADEVRTLISTPNGIQIFFDQTHSLELAMSEENFLFEVRQNAMDLRREIA
ncbi:MAG: hypothetical protein EOP48_14770 [Sphingobacteriales bacterium]|nr:MAG: hypothetical protein EOP48_14770 [Sphingobacteriales bacterium]